MGILGLLPLLQNIQQAIKIEDLRGCKVGIDASSWIYPALYSCSWELFTKEKTDRYMHVFEEAILLLVRNDVQPVVVFDGDQILAKAHTKELRERKKKDAERKAKEAIKENNLEEAKAAARQAITVTEEIVQNLMQVLKKHDVPYIRAPYEADPQLVYMAKAGVIEFIISEDADMLVYGAQRVIYKWDRHRGEGCLIDHQDLWMAFNFEYSDRTFRILCILLGCDYVHKLKNLGVNSTLKFVEESYERDMLEEVQNISRITKRNIEVPEEYKFQMKKAIHVFRHQIIYDLASNSLCPLTPYPEDFIDHGIYAGDISNDNPIIANRLEKVWLTEPDLDASRVSDVSWVPSDGEEEAEDEEEDKAYQTRQGGQTYTLRVLDVEEWTVPGLPVLTLPLAICKNQEDDSDVAVSVLGNDLSVQDEPTTVYCTSSCYINIRGLQFLLLWSWEVMEALQRFDFESESAGSSIVDSLDRSNSEGEGDDVVHLVDEEEGEDEDADTGTHVAGFKVLSVTRTAVRRDHMRAGYHAMNEGRRVKASIEPEQNKYDRNAIKVNLEVDNKVEHVGYIPSELCPYIHPAIRNNKITAVEVQHIRFRTFASPGYYMRLLITKQGRWDNYVIRKSIHAK